jgi:hypothetical protein
MRCPRPIASPHLTGTREHQAAACGQAHFAIGTAGMTCRQCRFWDRPQRLPRGGRGTFAFRCLKALEFAIRAGRNGRLPKVPSDAKACKYFAQRTANQGGRHDS